MTLNKHLVPSRTPPVACCHARNCAAERTGLENYVGIYPAVRSQNFQQVTGRGSGWGLETALHYWSQFPHCGFQSISEQMPCIIHPVRPPLYRMQLSTPMAPNQSQQQNRTENENREHRTGINPYIKRISTISQRKYVSCHKSSPNIAAAIAPHHRK